MLVIIKSSQVLLQVISSFTLRNQHPFPQLTQSCIRYIPRQNTILAKFTSES